VHEVGTEDVEVEAGVVLELVVQEGTAVVVPQVDTMARAEVVGVGVGEAEVEPEEALVAAAEAVVAAAVEAVVAAVQAVHHVDLDCRTAVVADGRKPSPEVLGTVCPVSILAHEWLRLKPRSSLVNIFNPLVGEAVAGIWCSRR